MLRTLALIGVASITPTVDAVRCKGSQPVYTEPECEVRECRATFGTNWKNADTCLRAPTCEELQGYSSYTKRLSGKCGSSDATGASECFQVRDGFPFALTVSDKRNTGDDATCAGNNRWFSFCVTREASGTESLVIKQTKRFQVADGQETFAVAAARAGCNGHSNREGDPLRPYGAACGETFASKLLQQKIAFEGGSLTYETMNSSGLERNYYVYRSPKNLELTDRDSEGAADASMVVDIHGLTSCAEVLAFYSGWYEVAKERNMVVVWPQSTELYGFNYFTGTLEQGIASWAAPNIPVPATFNGIDDVAFLREIIYKLQELPINQDRVYMAGHSNGAAMAQHFAFMEPSMVAAVATHSLFLTSLANLATVDTTGDNLVAAPATYPSPLPFVLSPSVPVINIHGTADSVIKYDEVTCEEGDQACLAAPGAIKNNAQWGLLNQCVDVLTNTPTFEDFTTYNVITYGNCAGGVETKLLTVPNGRHNAYQNAIDSEGNTVTVPSTELAWEFVSQYPKTE